MSRKAQLLRMAASERGEGKLKAIIVTVILASLAFTAYKLLPPYIAEYQLNDKMQETARFASVTRAKDYQIVDTIFRTIEDLDIPATKDDVKVVAVNGKVTISVDYTVPIDLWVYKFEIHFSPTTSNKDII